MIDRPKPKLVPIPLLNEGGISLRGGNRPAILDPAFIRDAVVAFGEGAKLLYQLPPNAKSATNEGGAPRGGIR